MSSAAYLNSALVGKFGMRLLSHTAVVCAVIVSAVLVILIRADLLGVIGFTLVYCIVNGLFVIVSSNANALAMEPQGHIAGTASSLFGSITTLMSALIAHGVGHLYDGTAAPLAWATLACGLAALGIIAMTEHGKLFRPGLTR
jgi:DHA1 family bicyclomycin/chloramphenicol resistance-like MFS transporter